MKAHPHVRCMPVFPYYSLAEFMHNNVHVPTEIITLESLGSTSYPYEYSLSELYLIIFDKASLLKYYEGKLTTESDWFSLLAKIE